MFYRPVEYSVGSPDNALLGASFKLKIAKNIQLYSQVLIDEFYLKFLKERKGWWANKQGYQAGFKVFNLFHLNNLYLQGEANYVRPYTYSHGNSIQNYGHYNQSLAHPLGANFKEAVGIVRGGVDAATEGADQKQQKGALNHRNTRNETRQRSDHRAELQCKTAAEVPRQIALRQRA